MAVSRFKCCFLYSNLPITLANDQNLVTRLFPLPKKCNGILIGCAAREQIRPFLVKATGSILWWAMLCPFASLNAVQLSGKCTQMQINAWHIFWINISYETSRSYETKKINKHWHQFFSVSDQGNQCESCHTKQIAH